MTDPDQQPRRYPAPITGAAARTRPSRVAQVGVGVGRGVGRGAKAVVHGTGVAGRATYRATRRATHAQGAGDTGLSRLIETHALHNAGDAVVAISLAGSLFFAVPTGEARGQVALFLLLTLLPFSILAPFVGPFLDRFRHGRRWAIGSTLALRAFLCWALAGSLEGGGSTWWQFPAALGILVASKAYNVTRSAATPRLLPAGMTLVKANGRMSLAGVIGAAVAVPLAVAAATAGPQWSLRIGFVIFVVGTVLAILLPAQVDSSRGEQEVGVSELAGIGEHDDPPGDDGTTPHDDGGATAGAARPVTPGVGRRLARWAVPPDVVLALRANFGLRLLSGFLTIFLAFVLRSNPPAGWEGRFALLFGLVVAGAGVGSALGTLAGSLLRNLTPRVLLRVTLVVDVVIVVVAAVNFGVATMVVLTIVVGLCQTLGKFALDATIQEQVPEKTRTSVFGRSETMIQLAWVLGGGLGVLLPPEPRLGLGVVAGILLGWLVLVLRTGRAQRLGPATGLP